MSDVKNPWGEAIWVLRLVGDDRVEEQVTVRAVPMRLADDYIKAIGNDARLICMATGKDPEWVQDLLSESFEALAEATQRINTIPLLAARTNSISRMEVVATGMRERFERAMKKAMEEAEPKTSSTPSLPGSPSIAAAASTPSGSGLTPTFEPSAEQSIPIRRE